uniref:(northern house mosquito) hypothetical protein n=1 Tax=Culex pipiens TaxID=7175 RepID=A0A8D8F4F4_CULPI
MTWTKFNFERDRRRRKTRNLSHSTHHTKWPTHHHPRNTHRFCNIHFFLFCVGKNQKKSLRFSFSRLQIFLLLPQCRLTQERTPRVCVRAFLATFSFRAEGPPRRRHKSAMLPMVTFGKSGVFLLFLR